MKSSQRVIFLAAVATEAVTLDEQHAVNPIRRVVTMLQMMQNKVAAEGQKKKEIFDKFMCYCDNADSMLGGAIQSAENKMPILDSQLKETLATKKQLDADIQRHGQEKIAAKEAISSAMAQREKEHTDFVKEEGTLKYYIGELDKAMKMLSAGMIGNLAGSMGFLQTKTASVLRDLSITADMGPVDRQVLASFLSGKNRGASTDPVAGILSEMKEKYEKDLNATTTDEANAVQGLEDLVAAKEKEIEALGQSIESKAIRSGEIAVKHSEMLNDYEDTQEELAKNKKFLVSLDSSCDQKRKEWSAYQQLQSQESLALADTIKILNDDDALELFKKTLPKASLLQFKVSDKRTRQRALDVLRRHPHSSVQLQFVELALRGGKQGFDKIVALMDQLMAQLKNDQKEDDEKKDYCENEIDKTHDKKKSLQHAASDMEIVIDDAQEYISNLKVEIEALDDGIRALDKEVEEATSNRKEAHEEYVQAAAENKASVDIIKFAKRRLNKFYNPSQVQPVKRKLSEEEQIQANMGYSFVQIRDDADDADDQAPPPPPEADLGYTTKGEESAGVIRMMDNLVNDVEKDMQESDLEEKDAQRDYEEFMDNAATKRAEDSKAITDKTVALGNTEEELSNGKEGLRNTNQKLMETEKYLGSLHAECDWLMKYYDTRKEARSGEIDSMEKAKAVLNGADYSM